MKIPATTAVQCVNYIHNLNYYLGGYKSNQSVNRSLMILPAAGKGTCYCIWSDKHEECIVSGNNCHEGSPKCIELGSGGCNCVCDD